MKARNPKRMKPELAHRARLFASNVCCEDFDTMADKEMIAATLAAGLMAGKNFSGSRGTPESFAVETYKRVLAALIEPESAPSWPRR